MINYAKLRDDVIEAWFQHGYSDRREDDRRMRFAKDPGRCGLYSPSHMNHQCYDRRTSSTTCT